MLYVGFTMTPQWLDEIYSEEWPTLIEALKREYPDEYWAALQGVITAAHTGRPISNPLPALFGSHAAFASDETHRQVLEAYIAFLRDGMEQDADFCLGEDPPESALSEVRALLFDAIA